VKLHGTFTAKAGSICGKGLSSIFARMKSWRSCARADLGVEQQQVDVLAFENGLWNRISGQDVQSEFSVMPELAWRKQQKRAGPLKRSKLCRAT